MFEDIPVFPLDTPAIRPVEMIPVRTQDNQTLLMIRDPLGLIEGAAVLMPDPLLLVFLEMADGKTGLGEMASKVTELTGQIIPAGMFESMAKQLDDALLLQSEKFVEAMEKKYKDYMDSPVRPYKVFRAQGEDRLKMMKELGEEMRRHRMSSISPPAQLDLPDNAVVGVLSPHIDYNRGGEAYAWAYQALKENGTDADTYIILGTVHRPTATRFIATSKDYDTPFGTIETDKALLEELEKEFGDSLTHEEFVHADEHTIELQATYLKYVFNDRPVKIVPILVGGFEELLEEEEEASPKNQPDIQQFCAALRAVLERHGDKIGIIGGVDFSHCGPEFGQEQVNDEEREKEIEAGDRETLTSIETGDPDEFFNHFRPTMNERNICSIAPIYCVMEALKDRAKARVLTYQQANSQDKSGLVSFASVAFVKNGASEEKKPKIILVSR